MAALVSALPRCANAVLRGGACARWSVSVQSRSMAGHNKWSKIHRSKAASDARFAKVINKTVMDIAIAVREGGADPKVNLNLAGVLQRAKAANLSKTVLDRAIARASSGKGSTCLLFEGRASEGYSLLVETMPVNLVENRAKMMKMGRTLGVTLVEGKSAGPAFLRKGLIHVEDTSSLGSGEDVLTKAEELAIEVGAEDVRPATDDEGKPAGVEFICAPSDLHTVAKELGTQSLTCKTVELTYIADSDLAVTLSEDSLEAAGNVLSTIEEDEEVLSVHHNIVN